MIEHFTSTKNGKSDPQLVWNFGQHEVEVKSLESSVDSKGKSFFLVLAHWDAKNNLQENLSFRQNCR